MIFNHFLSNLPDLIFNTFCLSISPRKYRTVPKTTIVAPDGVSRKYERNNPLIMINRVYMMLIRITCRYLFEKRSPKLAGNTINAETRMIPTILILTTMIKAKNIRRTESRKSVRMPLTLAIFSSKAMKSIFWKNRISNNKNSSSIPRIMYKSFEVTPSILPNK